MGELAPQASGGGVDKTRISHERCTECTGACEAEATLIGNKTYQLSCCDSCLSKGTTCSLAEGLPFVLVDGRLHRKRQTPRKHRHRDDQGDEDWVTMSPKRPRQDIPESPTPSSPSPASCTPQSSSSTASLFLAASLYEAPRHRQLSGKDVSKRTSTTTTTEHIDDACATTQPPSSVPSLLCSAANPGIQVVDGDAFDFEKELDKCNAAMKEHSDAIQQHTAAIQQIEACVASIREAQEAHVEAREKTQRAQAMREALGL